MTKRTIGDRVTLLEADRERLDDLVRDGALVVTIQRGMVELVSQEARRANDTALRALDALPYHDTLWGRLRWLLTGR